MSDNTANAREPSMEDILASIRRIIDEEDTRDGRPSSDSFDDERRADGVDTSMPVMAPAAANREQEASAPVAEAEGGSEEGEEAIFPERESLFWSRATGRGAPVPGPTDDDEASGGIGGAALAGAAAATAGAAAVGSSATDIFTRAQNKLGGTMARSGSTRERMQSLAARTATRVEETTDDVVDPLADLADLDGLPELDDVADDALPDFSAVEDDDTPDVLELTDPVETPEPDAQDGIESLVYRAGVEKEANVETEAPDEAIGEATEADADEYATAFETVAPLHVVEDDTAEPDAAEVVDEAEDRVDRAAEQDDVFDLTTPLDAEPEDGAEDNATAIEAEAEDGEPTAEVEAEVETATETSSEGLPEIGPGQRLEDEYSARFYGDTPSVEDDAPEVVASSAIISEPFGHGDAADHDFDEGGADEGDSGEGDIAHAGSLTTGDSYEVNEIEKADEPEEVAGEEPSSEDHAGEETASEEPSWATGFGAAAAVTAGVAAGSTSDFYASKDDGDDAPDMEEPLGFSDTFSASDVYHDDPPALDDDYSASLDREDEPVMARAGFAGEDAFGDEPSAMVHPDDEMDKVGGLVRDAMERDPVDYADPSALVSMSSEEISARALASLADVEGEASRRMYGALRVGESGESESIEGMVKGMLRPMLREWLDDNLPNMVETMVRGEVERISAKSRKYSRASDED